MNKTLLILLILCSQDVWIPILDQGIEYPVMVWLPIIMHNVIKTHVNHHVSPVVETSCSRDEMFLHIWRAIAYGLILRWVTLQTWPLTTLDMLVVIPFFFRRTNAKNFNVTRQPTCHKTLMNAFAYRLCHIYNFPSLMEELVHMHDVWNKPVLNQNVSCSVQN